MLVHSVFFWLPRDWDEAQRATFIAALRALGGIPHKQGLYVGHPADVPARPVLDSTWDVSITLLFADRDEHDAYQTHPVHKDFLENHAGTWAKVQIYDSQA
ncbi:MAG: Dabb family protein [Planctomycetota bacterium]